MKKVLHWFMVSTAVFCFFPAGIISQSSFSCNSFMLKHDSDLIFGHSLDMPMIINGMVVVNKRNVYKTGHSWDELTSSEKRKSPDIAWTSKYGSITVNPLARDFPDGGMNEAGLCIWEMGLEKTKFIENDTLPKLFMTQWMQYVLDNFESVDQVIKSTSEITIDGWGWHFFTGDRDGRCAAIEFLGGELVLHTGRSLPVTMLGNSIYTEELSRLQEYEGFGGNKVIDLKNKNTPKFIHAAYMLKNYKPSDAESIIDYGFTILKQIDRGRRQWSIVCDMKRLKVYFRTSVGKDIRYVSFDSFDFSNESPVKILDINADLSGNVAENFEDYTLRVNRELVEEFVNLMKRDPGDPDLEKNLVSRGITSQILKDRLANYAETTINK